MGILGLAKVIADVAPNAIKESEIKHYFGRKVAVDASMCLYQFLIAVRSEGAQLTSVDGETTSHLMGIFYRTIRFIENGIKPVYVFDGKPPELKSKELVKRTERREDAQKELDKATEAGDAAMIEKFNRRLVKVTSQHVEEAKQLLKLMGVPYVEAPCEAEAQCASMVASGKVYATATEDMDALTFGSKVLLRHMTFSEARKMPIQEYHLEKILNGLSMTKEEFIDFCILLGCDYCPSIRGIGPKRAIELIGQFKSIENILHNIDIKKYVPPEDWNYKEARKLFVDPDVSDVTEEFKWVDPDEDGLVKYLCGDKQFNEDRVRSGVKKLLKCRSTTTQGRLDGFFTVLPSTNTPKRKIENGKTGSTPKRGKTGGSGRGRGRPK